jgi:uncharacterized glyoxalase superfamily protein PhnB
MQTKPTITGARYVLAVNNIQASVEYYINQLGFEILWIQDDWAFITRGSAKIMLGECPDEKPALETGCHSYFAYIEVANIDALYDEYLEKQVDIGSAIEDKPWGQREFSIRTVDGHRITFGAGLVNQ